MRMRSLLALGAVAVLALSGCAPGPEPKPKPSASPSTPETPPPTPEPVEAPEAAFDVTCEDLATTMATLVGEPSTPVEPVMSTVSTMSWLPGPGQYMFQRSGGLACSAGEEPSYWEVTMIPDAQGVIDGAAERNGFWGEQADCNESGCSFEIVEGDVLLSARIVDAGLGASLDPGPPGDALRGLAAAAASTLHDVVSVDSAIVGAECERFLTAQELADSVGGETRIVSEFGGWGIPAEVYHVVNGSKICLYTDGGDEYSGVHHLTITTLPGGAWAFERTPGEAIDVEGADEARLSTDASGATALDLRVGPDWIRLTTRVTEAATMTGVAEKIVRNLTKGHTAPQ
ncbi:hypothetical protein [Microbacterium sp. SD291]|uniref:hypothetical protein n=1 Tax=Microbacterium sp. SD291 TaxID=2782007 RepID=UPI001A9737C0|nr:hypothetical protein [Microbacterium sp. SD291]MBO0980406.1 hypothetical protein [Microbacterium sp. SD291]